MDQTLRLLQTEALFHVESRLRSPSLFRFMVASLKSGLFTKEDAFVRLSDRIEKLKNVGAVLRIQQTLKKLCGISHLHSQSKEAIAAEHSFDQPSREECGVEHFCDASEALPSKFEEECDS